MCLATPVRIKKIQDNIATLENGREVNVSLVNSPKSGDWLLCHADLAINKVKEKEAKEILKLVQRCHHPKDINVSYHTSPSPQSS